MSMPSVAFVGYGRFGRALGERFAQFGAHVRAYDPGSAVPESVAAASLPELAREGEGVFLAVPVAALEGVLSELAPHLTEDHLVMDVGSVKVGPSRVMESHLGARVPWVATHPLFGPTSLALEEQPLRVVVCPNPLHGDAAERAAALYSAIGCVVHRQDADAHDRVMAQTHALAYFVAKGFLDAGVELDSDLVPPSAMAIHRVVEAVREDAGHLFASLHRENPYAEVARRRLLDSLTSTDELLREAPPADEVAHHESAALQIAELETHAPQLGDLREIIDELDTEIVDLLRRRVEIASRIVRVKDELGHGVLDPARERALLEGRRELARMRGLDPEAVASVFEAILRYSRQHQREVRLRAEEDVQS